MGLYADSEGKDFELEQGKILELAEAGAKHGDATSLTVHVS